MVKLGHEIPESIANLTKVKQKENKSKDVGALRIIQRGNKSKDVGAFRIIQRGYKGMGHQTSTSYKRF